MASLCYIDSRYIVTFSFNYFLWWQPNFNDKTGNLIHLNKAICIHKASLMFWGNVHSKTSHSMLCYDYRQYNHTSLVCGWLHTHTRARAHTHKHTPWQYHTSWYYQDNFLPLNSNDSWHSDGTATWRIDDNDCTSLYGISDTVTIWFSV